MYTEVYQQIARKNDTRVKKKHKKNMSEVGFEPTPTNVDCDLNAAP